MNDPQDRILTYLDDVSEELADTFSALIRIPTVNPYSGDPDPSGESAGQAFVEPLLEALGGEVTTIPVPSDIYTKAGILGPRQRDWTHRQNLVGRFRFGDGSGPTIVLDGHMDTIGVSDFEGEPFSGKRDGDIVHGRGASDCKSGIVAGLYAIKALQNSGASLNANLVFASVVDEECNGAGAGTLSCCLADVRGDYCLVLDGFSGMLYTSCQGILTAEITVKGRAGHGSVGGVSAVEKLLVAKQAIDRLAEERRKSQPKCLINIGVIHAGLAPWTVPNHGWLAANINFAYAEAKAAEDAGRGFCGILVRERLESILDDLCREDEWLSEHPPRLEWIKDCPPFCSDDAGNPEGSSALLDAARESYKSAWKRDPEIGSLGAWCDAAHTARVGKMPTIGMGAGKGGTSHTATEHNSITNVRNTAATVALTILRLCEA